jgi:putative ABC transport system permease protein
MRDVILGIRALRATPTVTIVVMLSLALGIGANTAFFSIIDSLLLRPLPVKDPQRLVMITADTQRGFSAWTYAIWDQFRRHEESFESLAAWNNARFSLSGGGESQFVDGIWASGGLFDMLGVPAMLGRTFTDSDDQRGGGPDGPVVVISYRFWQRQFGGAADVIGKSLNLDRQAYTIIGVTPPGFFGPDVGRMFDVAVPIGTEPLIKGKETLLDQGWAYWLIVMGRLKPGESADAATAALRALQPQMREITLPPGPPGRVARYLTGPITVTSGVTGASFLRQQYERPLITMLVVVALVLLIACANIANLLLSRATARRQEWSMRRALGASRWRIMRLVFVESLILAACGTILGLAVAQAAGQLIVRQLSTLQNTIFLDLALDWRVFAFTSAATVLTALIVGTAAAVHAAGAEPIDALKESGRGTADTGRSRLASALVVAQIALSLVLVVASVLFVRTFASLANLDLGYDRDRVLAVTVNAQRTTMPVEERLHTWAQIHERVRTVPGVAAASVAFLAPVGGGYWSTNVSVSDGSTAADLNRNVAFNAVMPGWFKTMGTTILSGRDFDEHDNLDAQPVILVNEAFARRFLHGANPIGHTMTLFMEPATARPRRIIGLIRDATYSTIRNPVPPTMYVPLTQFYPDSKDQAPAAVQVNVRAGSGSPALLARPVGAAISNVNHDLALTFQLLSDQVDGSLAQERLIARLAAFFGLLALLLAGLGLYGVTAYAVSRRRVEIGIRMALGAMPSAVVRMVLRRVALLMAFGVVIGIGVSLWATTFIASLLWGLEPRDPLTLAGAALILAAVGILAGWLPAWRASRVDPARELRAN